MGFDSSMKSLDNKYPLVYITWIDAESDNGWEDESALDAWIKKERLVHDVGWLVRESKDSVIIVNQLCTDGDTGNRTKIPRGMIKEIKKINIVRKK